MVSSRRPPSRWWLILVAAVTTFALIATTGAQGEEPTRVRRAASPTFDLARVQMALARARETNGPAHNSADRLRPCPRRVKACVDLREERAWLQRRGAVTYGPVRVGFGTRRHPTPKGTFRVKGKARHYRSTSYGIAMPYSVFFTRSRDAFHVGPLGRQSHGCVHLRRADARVFFHRLHAGDLVYLGGHR